ncbi:MAG: hypothetical protein ACFFD1_00955 [Candidatus Thorarchaeota archaeon]
MKYDKRIFGRIRLNRSEILALKEIFEKTRPIDISNFNGERQAIGTLTSKILPLIIKLEDEKEM